MIIIKCKECGKKIKTYPSRIGRKKYCSPKCRGKNNPKKFKNGHKWVGKLRVEKRKSNKYIEIYSPHHPYKNIRNAVLEHRLVVEKFIGRFLLPNEVVHHKNGNKKDNRIKNLEVFLSNTNHIKHEYKTNIVFRKKMKKNQFKKGHTPLHKGKTKKDFPNLANCGRYNRNEK
mgnify:CR=1 FL=1